MDKELIKEVVKEMIRDEEIFIHVTIPEYRYDWESKVENPYDVKTVIGECIFELEVSGNV
ncbi:hypothetical protein [Pseudoalteromonas phage PH357]|nr:hypothetical protein [Pseudoalteromonas phage PH357]